MIRYILFFILLVSFSAKADDIRITPGYESFSYESKDKVNKGSIDLYSSFNPNFKVQYNKNLSKSNKLSFAYKIQYLNFGKKSFDKENLVLNNLYIGQNFFIEKNNLYYYLGAQDRFFLSSQNGNILLSQIMLPSLTVGINHSYFELDEHIIGLGARITHINSLGQSINGFEIKNGTELTASLNFSRYFKKFFYRIYLEGSYDSQNTSITDNRMIKNYIGIDFNFRF